MDRAKSLCQEREDSGRILFPVSLSSARRFPKGGNVFKDSLTLGEHINLYRLRAVICGSRGRRVAEGKMEENIDESMMRKFVHKVFRKSNDIG